MITSLTRFKERFKGFENQYVLNEWIRKKQT